MGRAAPPARAPCTQQRRRILQHHWGPVSKPWQRQSLRPPFKGLFSWPVPWNPFSGTPCPIFPPSTSDLERGISAIEGQVYFWGGSWALIFSQSPGWGRGGGDASPKGECLNSSSLGSCAQSYPCLFVLSPEVRLGSQCVASKEPASQRVPGAPPAGAQRAGPCCCGHSGAPSGGSAPCEEARDASATVNGAARQDPLSPGPSGLCGPATHTE